MYDIVTVSVSNLYWMADLIYDDGLIVLTSYCVTVLVVPYHSFFSVAKLLWDSF